jgi:hypothetical protein
MSTNDLDVLLGDLDDPQIAALLREAVLAYGQAQYAAGVRDGARPGGPPTRQAPEHQHEAWQLQDHARGGKYCAACGDRVVVMAEDRIVTVAERFWTRENVGPGELEKSGWTTPEPDPPKTLLDDILAITAPSPSHFATQHPVPLCPCDACRLLRGEA